jgi:transketolase
VSALFDCRQAFAAALERLAAQDRRVVVLTNDSVSSSNLGGFAALFPERLVNVGIAEQNMIGMAAGLANGGKIPFVCGASCFLTARGMEQIKVDVAYSEANVKICAMTPGVAYGALGATHHSTEDLAWMRPLATLTVVVPADPLETAQAVQAAAAQSGPVFLRISRMPAPEVHPPSYHLEIGKAARLRQGSDVTLIANGTMVTVALQAADLLAARGVAARVLNMATLRPLDVEAITRAATETQGIVTLEEASTCGGLGGAVAEAVATRHPAPMRILGFPGFAVTGPTDFLLRHYGLTPEGAAQAALDILRRVGE